MGLSISPALEDTLLLEGLIVYLIARRSYRLVYGAPYSAGRIYVTMGLYALLFGLALLDTYFLLPLYFLAIDAAILATGLVLFLGHAERTVAFDRKADGGWTYRLPWLVAALYLVLWVARLGIDLVYFPEVLEFNPVPSIPSFAALVALGVVDVLFALSTGFMLGRNLGVLRAHGRLLAQPTSSARDPAALPTEASPSEPASNAE